MLLAVSFNRDSKSGLWTYLLHLHSIYQDVRLVVSVIEEEETAVLHNRVVLLSDLVGLRKVSVYVVFAIKLDQGQNATSEAEGRFDGQIEALFIQNGQHARQA